MGFWSKIGLVGYKDLQHSMENLNVERNAFKREIQELFREQQTKQEAVFNEIKSTLGDSLKSIELKHNDELETVLIKLDDVKAKGFNQLNEIKELSLKLETKIELVQEIAKIQWAGTLIDYIDELLDEVEVHKHNNGTMAHPLTYDFGEVSNLFKFIYDCTKRSGVYVGWKDTKQTIQLYFNEEDGKIGKNQIGAIKYEGSNDFSKSPPHSVSLRFITQNIPKKLIRDLYIILGEKAIINVEKEEAIIFKFNQDTPENRVKIKKILRVLRHSKLLVG